MIASNDQLPLISIVLATYNGSAYLATQLDSIFVQTYGRFEVIAVDDASTDDTYAILQSYAARYPHLQVHRNERNLGFIANFEKACSLARGELIALCDQDDYWLPEKLEKLVAFRGDAALVHCNSALCNEKLEPTGVLASDRAEFKPIGNPLEQAVFCRIYGHASLITRELLDKALPFLPRLPHDWWLCYFATFNGGIRYLPEVLVYYRQHANNAIGAVGGKNRNKESKAARRDSKQQLIADIRNRVAAFYRHCPDRLVREKKVLRRLHRSYQSFDPVSGIQRMVLFFQYRNTFLGVKKRNALRKLVFCIKMLWTVK